MIYQWFLFLQYFISKMINERWMKEKANHDITHVYNYWQIMHTNKRLLNDLIYMYTNISAHMSYNWVIILKRLLDIT